MSDPQAEARERLNEVAGRALWANDRTWVELSEWQRQVERAFGAAVVDALLASDDVLIARGMERVGEVERYADVLDGVSFTPETKADGESVLFDLPVGTYPVWVFPSSVPNKEGEG